MNVHLVRSKKQGTFPQSNAQRQEALLQDLHLELAQNESLKWVKRMCREQHYLHTWVANVSRPLAYIISWKSTHIGLLVFNRMQCSKCEHWFGPWKDVQAGKCDYSQWEFVNLARVWVAPQIQEKGSSTVDNVLSQMIAQALKRIPYEYLMVYPPAFFDQAWELLFCSSYCQNFVFSGAIYKACNFRIQRTSDNGIRTYVHDLRPLRQHEIDSIMIASAQSSNARRKRAKKRLSEEMVMTPLFRRNRWALQQVG